MNYPDSIVFDISVQPDPNDIFFVDKTDLIGMDFVQGIRKRRLIGDTYAWFTVHVKCFHKDVPSVVGYTFKTGCSFESREDFEDSNFYRQLKAIAYYSLKDNLHDCYITAQKIAGFLNDLP